MRVDWLTLQTRLGSDDPQPFSLKDSFAVEALVLSRKWGLSLRSDNPLLKVGRSPLPRSLSRLA